MIPIDHAYANVRTLLDEAGLTDATFARDPDAEEAPGSFAFDVAIPGYTEEHGTVPVDISGVPLEKFKSSDHLAARVWIDGKCWWWENAISVLRDWVSSHQEEEADERERLAALRLARARGQA